MYLFLFSARWSCSCERTQSLGSPELAAKPLLMPAELLHGERTESTDQIGLLVIYIIYVIITSATVCIIKIQGGGMCVVYGFCVYADDYTSLKMLCPLCRFTAAWSKHMQEGSSVQLLISEYAISPLMRKQMCRVQAATCMSMLAGLEHVWQQDSQHSIT